MAKRQRAPRAGRGYQAPTQEPLEERVDKAGVRALAQRNARRIAAAARAKAKAAPRRP